MNKHKKRFLWTLLGEALIFLGMFKIYWDYKAHAGYIWWEGAFMNPAGHFLYLEIGLGMSAIGYLFLLYMHWYRWKIDPRKRF